MPKRIALLALLVIGGWAALLAQSSTSGDLTGTITDPSGAALEKALVVASNLATNFRQETVTSREGAFRISLLTPGKYSISVIAAGFQTVETVATVVIGSTRHLALELQLTAQSATVEVVAENAGVQTENGDVRTNVDSLTIQGVPNPGGDVTFYAQLAPGAVMNTNQGYGNFSFFGLPATSNLFTLNGQNDNDPFLNLNKSGATNLLLGANELAEVSITANSYSAQNGQLAGANVNFGTKSGSNAVHGNANYYWDGRILNANNFFNNANGVPRQFVNANQWAASLGGPIRKDKTFFFLNHEGLQVVLPTSSSLILLPSPQFQAATLSNLMTTGMNAEIPFYQQLFKAFNSATGIKRSTAVPMGSYDMQGPGCGDLTALAPGVPCALEYSAAPNAHAHEWQYAGRVDQIISEHDLIYGRFQTDHGVAPAFTDPINPVFSAVTIQPEDQGQFSWTHILSSSATNQFVGSTIYSNTPFTPSNQVEANTLLPYFMGVGDGSFSSLNTAATFTPQGREILQYQVVDDFSYVNGKHTLKAGLNFHRDLINDYDFETNTGGELFFGSIDDVYSGVLGSYGFFAQNFPLRRSQDIRTSQMGAYLQDDLRIRQNLKLTLSLRADHNGIPSCPAGCFASSLKPFDQLNHDATIPYNQAIQTDRRQAYLASDFLVWQPRIGFAYSPFATSNTVMRGGFGIFGDALAAGVVDGFVENMPQFNSIFLQGTAGYDSTMVGSGVAGSVFDIARSADQAINSGFASGGTLASISSGNSLFSPPSLITSNTKVRIPRYYEWNLEIQHQFRWNVTGSVNYVGNRGVHELIANNGLNAYCQACTADFKTFPTDPPDQRFFGVTQYQSLGESRYNGLVVSARKTLSAHMQFGVSYTYSHSLDDVSNGGFAGFGGNAILAPLDPFNLRAYNWGNSDYDVRHYFAASYVINDVFRSAGMRRGPDHLFGGWTLAGTLFRRTGFFFSVTDSASNLADGATTLLAYSTTRGRPNCGGSAVYTSASPCLTNSQFSSVIDPSSGLMVGLGNQNRNQYQGPGYFNTDLSVSKSIRVSEKVEFSLGAQFFNLFNHPNFAAPVSNIESPLFGQIVNTVSAPTSILGSFLGGDASPRLIQLHGRITF